MGNTNNLHKVHVVFNNSGLKLTFEELLTFKIYIHEAFDKPTMCKSKCNSNDCRSIVLNTPFESLVFAVSRNDLIYLKDLIEGTIFEISLNRFLNQLSVSRTS